MHRFSFVKYYLLFFQNLFFLNFAAPAYIGLELRRFYLKKNLQRFLKITAYIVLVSAIFLLFQAFFNSFDYVYYYGPVTNSESRSLLSIGLETINGNVDLQNILRLFFCLIFFSTLYFSLSNLKQNIFIKLIWALINLNIIIQLFVILVLSLFPSGESFLRQLVSDSNFLTSDMLWYRVSSFFSEPSQMSVIMGTLLAIAFQKANFRERIFLILILIFFFVSSRSLALFIIFFGYLAFTSRSKAIYLSTFTIFLISPLLIDLVTSISDELNLLRSIFERTYNPSYEYSNGFWLLFGLDFGATYSFTPGLGLIQQIGIIGLLIILFIFKGNLRVISLIMLFIFVVPQLWYTVFFQALAFALASINLAYKTYEKK